MRQGVKRELAAALGMGAAVSYLLQRRKTAVAFLGGAGALAAWGLFSGRGDRIEGQSALVTGGSRGLGLAIALELARRRCRITLVARDRDELARARARIEACYPGTVLRATYCDITHEAELFRTIDLAAREQGGLDLIVNNAGAILVGPFSAMKAEDFKAQMNLHLFAVVNSCRLALPYLRKSRGRRIVNICSMGGKVPVPHMLAYDASKFALSGFSQGLESEVKQDGISVTTIYPAVMRTGSPIQAVFKGDHEREFAWFSALDNLPFLSIPADTAARKILEAAEERRSELVLSLAGRIRNVAAALFPELAASLLSAISHLLPRGCSREAKTGADSRAVFDRSGFFVPFRWMEKRAMKRWNQRPKHDGRRQMGLDSHHSSTLSERY